MNTYAESAAKLGITASQVKYMAKKRKISVISLGHKTKRITDEEIERVISKRTRKAIV